MEAKMEDWIGERVPDSTPLFILRLSGPDEIQLGFSPLRRGGKAPGSVYVLENRQPFKGPSESLAQS